MREQGKARTSLLPGSRSAAAPPVPSLKYSCPQQLADLGFSLSLANRELQRSDGHIVKDGLRPRDPAGDGTSESMLPH